MRIMFALKAPTVLLLSVLVSHGQGGIVKSASPRDLFSEANQLYGELRRAVNIEVNHALEQLTALLGQISAISESVFLQAEQTTQSATEELAKELETLKSESLANDINPAPCTVGREDIILNMGSVVLEEIDTCVGSLMSSGLSMASGAISRTMTVQRTIDRLQLTIDNCRTDDDCLINFIGKVAVDIVEIPIELRENTDTTIDVVQALDNQIQRCGSDRENSVATIGAIIMREIRNCVSDLAQTL